MHLILIKHKEGNILCSRFSVTDKNEASH